MNIELWLGLINGATDTAYLETLRSNFEANFQSKVITYDEYMSLFNAYSARRATLGGAGTTTPPPTETTTPPEEVYTAEQQRALYEQAMGLPATGRSEYQKWVAEQWRTTVQEFEFGKALGQIPAEQTFQQFLASRQGRPLTELSPGVLASIRGLGGNVAPTSEEQASFFNQPTLWQRMYEVTRGIPAAGRNWWQEWLASRGQEAASRYALTAAGLLGGGTSGTLLQYLNTPGGQPSRGMGGEALNALTALDPTAQRAMLENLPNYVEQQALYGGLQGRFPAFYAQGLAGQAFSEPSRRAFEISPEAIGGGSWLNYLRGKYGI